MFIEYIQQFEDPRKYFHMPKISHFKKVCTIMTSIFLCVLLMVPLRQVQYALTGEFV